MQPAGIVVHWGNDKKMSYFFVTRYCVRMDANNIIFFIPNVRIYVVKGLGWFWNGGGAKVKSLLGVMRPPNKGYHGCRVVSCKELKATYANVKKYHAAGRKSPPLPGNHSLCRGTVQRGNDSNLWHSKELRPDVFRWVREKTCKQLKANVKKYHAAGRKSAQKSAQKSLYSVKGVGETTKKSGMRPG